MAPGAVDAQAPCPAGSVPPPFLPPLPALKENRHPLRAPLQARMLHVCGDPGALPLLRQLVEECGDELEVRCWLLGGGCM